MAARTGPSKRTAAQRAAIDKRADAYPRPLSGTQLRALWLLDRACSRKTARGFFRSVAGWHAVGDSLHAFSTQTIDSLRKRLLAKRWRSAIVITGAGRREAARHR